MHLFLHFSVVALMAVILFNYTLHNRPGRKGRN